MGPISSTYCAKYAMVVFHTETCELHDKELDGDALLKGANVLQNYIFIIYWGKSSQIVLMFICIVLLNMAVVAKTKLENFIF